MIDPATKDTKNKTGSNNVKNKTNFIKYFVYFFKLKLSSLWTRYASLYLCDEGTLIIYFYSNEQK